MPRNDLVRGRAVNYPFQVETVNGAGARDSDEQHNSRGISSGFLMIIFILMLLLVTACSSDPGTLQTAQQTIVAQQTTIARLQADAGTAPPAVRPSSAPAPAKPGEVSAKPTPPSPLRLVLTDVTRAQPKDGWASYVAKFFVENTGQDYIPPAWPEVKGAAVSTNTGQSYAASAFPMNPVCAATFAFDPRLATVIMAPGTRILAASTECGESQEVLATFAVPETLTPTTLNLGALGTFDLAARTKFSSPFIAGEPSEMKTLPATLEVPIAVVSIAPPTLDKNSPAYSTFPVSVKSKVATGNITVSLRFSQLEESGLLRGGTGNGRWIGFQSVDVGPLQSYAQTVFVKRPEGRAWIVLDGTATGIFRVP